jgi:hypothetical protein
MRRTTTPVVLNDPLIRTALVARLRREGRLLMHEVDIAWSSSRADILTLDDELCGYEIKSDRDSFARLGDQMTSYRHIFDRVFIVTTERHRAKALSVRPPGVGVLVASGLPVEFRLVHPAGRNRSQRIDMLIDLLDHREVRLLARTLGLRGYSGLGKYDTIDRVIRSVPPARCRASVLDILRNRPNWHRAQSIAS